MINRPGAQLLLRTIPSTDTFSAVLFADTNLEEFYNYILASGGEGIILKNIEAPYSVGGRNKNWVAVKRNISIDAWVSGIFSSDKQPLASLEFSAIDSQTGKPAVVARVSTIPIAIREKIGSGEIEASNIVAEITGIDWSPKNKKIRKAKIARIRSGHDYKPKDECIF